MGTENELKSWREETDEWVIDDAPTPDAWEKGTMISVLTNDKLFVELREPSGAILRRWVPGNILAEVLRRAGWTVERPNKGT